MSPDVHGSIPNPKPTGLGDKDPQLNPLQQILAKPAEEILPAIADLYAQDVEFAYQRAERMLQTRTKNGLVSINLDYHQDKVARLRINANMTVAGERWPQLVREADDPDQVTKLVEAYAKWIDASDKGSYTGLRGGSPTEFMQTLATWMKAHHQEFSSDSPIVTAFRTLITQKEDEPNSRTRLRMRQSVFVIPENYKNATITTIGLETERKDLVEFCEAVNVHPSPHLIAERSKLKTLTGKWMLAFDVDGENIRKFQRNVKPDAQRIGDRRVHQFDEMAADLVLDTTALIAAKGGVNAEKVWKTLDARREAQTVDTYAKAVPVAEIINIANALTISINKADALVGEDGKPVKLDELPRGNIRYLAEAFRRILYTCLDLDRSLVNVGDIVDEFGIDERVELTMDYIWKREGGPRTKAVGSTAVNGARNARGEELRRQDGKPQYRAQLYVPGYGQIS